MRQAELDRSGRRLLADRATAERSAAKAEAIIVATGANARQLGLPSEKLLQGAWDADRRAAERLAPLVPPPRQAEVRSARRG